MKDYNFIQEAKPTSIHVKVPLKDDDVPQFSIPKESPTKNFKLKDLSKNLSDAEIN